MSQQPSDEQLMSKVKMGEVAAFEILFARYQQPLFNFILRMLGDFHKAEDIFQETFLRVFRHAHKYDESYRFSPWLYQIARNLCLEEIRRQRKVETLPVDEEDDCQPIELWDKNTPDGQLEVAEAEQIVQSAILRLSEQQREVFILRENHGLSYDEISQITNLSVSAVKSCLHRARMVLKEMLTPYLKSGKIPSCKGGKRNDEM